MRIPKEQIEVLTQGVLALRDDYEFRTFWLGVTVRGPIAEAEATEVKALLKRGVGERLEALAPELEPRLKHPDVTALLFYPDLTVGVKVRPLSIYGRYLKFSREVPQSRWHCLRCRGRGCSHCGGSGRRFERTVEEIVAPPLVSQSRAAGWRFHGAGREDVDVRMVGRGRPFVIELLEPRVRSLDLAAAEAEITHAAAGDIAVRELCRAHPTLHDLVKTVAPEKSYRARVVCGSPAAPDRVQALGALRDFTTAQETPRRVLHRRANKVRRRLIRDSIVEDIALESGRVRAFTLALRVQSGTYIKEFISGDEGRCHPSVASLLDVPCDCVELDVTDVHWDPPPDLLAP